MIAQFADENFLISQMDGLYLWNDRATYKQLVAPWPPGYPYHPEAIVATTEEKGGEPDEIIIQYGDSGPQFVLELPPGEVYESFPLAADNWRELFV